MFGFVWEFLSNNGFQPHGMCMLWRPDVLYAHLGADLVTGAAYLSIPVALIHLALRRPDLFGLGVPLLFSAFIVACGTTHLFGIYTLWVPAYGVEAILKVATAAVSAATAIMLWPLTPRILSTPSPGALQTANLRLAAEVESRTQAEMRLGALNAELERRVTERTADLEKSNAELRAARAAADRANDMKSEFLASMSHEIRTPMNGVVGLLTLLKSDDLTADQTHLVDAATKSADSLMRLIDDILDYARVESGDVELRPTAVDIGALCDETVVLLGEIAAEKGVTLRLEAIDRASTPARLDATRVRQILWNLVGNAIKFTPSGGSVALRARVAQARNGADRLRIEVEDTGEGVPPEAQDRLFHRFSQVHRTISSSHGGVGLGLAISKRLVTAMGGDIGFESVAGRGSLFWFEVPLEPAEAVDTPAEPAASEPLRHLRILVAEDNATNQLLIESLLAREGHEVVLVSDGAQARDRAAHEDFDVVLMDVQMPVLDGLAATRSIRALDHRARSRTPVIALTAFAMESDRRACFDAGMTDVVTKPIDLARLRRALAAAVAATRRGRRDEGG